ncbi:MAG: periplasmic heavy metal sensor [Rhodospirillaceae bacterium]|nr:periplasmic heavy metal sensor [Rhodospirillaceae bacterium]
MTLSPTKARWLLGALIVSLCLNLFLLGGHFGGFFPPPWSKHGRMHGGIIMATVPDDLRPIIRERLRAASPESKAQREALRQEMESHRKRVAEALVAEPFDPARLTGELEALELTATSLFRRAHGRIAEIAAELTPEQRRQWAEGWREMGHRP